MGSSQVSVLEALKVMYLHNQAAQGPCCIVCMHPQSIYVNTFMLPRWRGRLQRIIWQILP